MASVQTSKVDGRYLKLTVTEESTSIENNTSTVRWTLESIGGNSNYYNVYSVEVKINNVTVYGPTTKTWDSKVFPAAKGSTTGTVTINHNNDGTASPLPFSLRGSVYNNNPQTYSDTLTLSTIPRASSITVSDANIGSATNIVINKASGSFTTTLYYKASGQNSFTKIVDKTANQVYGWTVPTSFYNLIPNSKTISCQFYAETYSGNTLIGTSDTVTATFTATGNPTINSCTIESIDTKTINLVGSARMIRYVSTVRVTVSASPAHNDGSTISSITINDVTATNGIVEFQNASDWQYNVVATDSRGYSSSNSYGITWTNYLPLTLNATIVRNQPTDGKIKISYSGNYYNGDFRTSSDTYVSNTLTVEYRAIEKGDSWTGVQWRPLSPTISGNTYGQNNYVIPTDSYAPNGYDYTKQYEFQIRAYDLAMEKPINGIDITKGKPIFWWDNSGLTVNGTFKVDGIVEGGTWTPTIGVLNETDPTVTYIIQTGKYKRIGNIVFFSFIIRANITTLNGTNNYAVIKGLPYYSSVSSVGDYACPLGSLYNALSNTSNVVMCPYDNYLRIQTTYGSSAAQWIVTPSGTFMEIGGSGFYFTS